MEFIFAHAGDVLTILTAVVTIASVLANFTKSDADNKLVAVFAKLVNTLALNFKAKP